MLAAAAGAVCRYLLDTVITSTFKTGFPWGTVLVNLSGSLAIGWLVGFGFARDLNPQYVTAISTGFLGAYTTFSTWMYQVVLLLEQKHYRAALMHSLGSASLGVFAVITGLWLATALS